MQLPLCNWQCPNEAVGISFAGLTKNDLKAFAHCSTQVLQQQFCNRVYLALPEQASDHTIPYSFNNVADICNLQQYCSIEHYQSGRNKVYNSYIVKKT